MGGLPSPFPSRLLPHHSEPQPSPREECEFESHSNNTHKVDSGRLASSQEPAASSPLPLPAAGGGGFGGLPFLLFLPSSYLHSFHQTISTNVWAIPTATPHTHPLLHPPTQTDMGGLSQQLLLGLLLLLLPVVGGWGGKDFSSSSSSSSSSFFVHDKELLGTWVGGWVGGMLVVSRMLIYKHPQRP